MKRISYWFLMISLITVTSCNITELSSSIDESEVVEINDNISTKRTLEEAVQIAKDAYRTSNNAKALSPIEKIAIEKANYIVAGSSTRSTSVDTLFYVLDFDNNNGFAIVSTNKATEGLIALIDKGSYEDSLGEDNEGFKMYMEMASTYVTSSHTFPELDRRMWLKWVTDTTATILDPMLDVEWGQTSIYGKYAKNGISGCVNTAMAQIMTYFKYPDTIDITYSGAEINLQTLDWNKMIKHKNNRQTCNLEEEDHEAISQLMRQLGELNNSTYDENSTGTERHKSIKTFADLGYDVSDGFIEYGSEDFYDILSSGSLLYFRGSYIDENNNTHGHAWVVDGAMEYTLYDRCYTGYRYSLEETLISESIRYSHYLHINWGWDGNCNGYFSAGVFATLNGETYDNSYHSADHVYDTDIEYFVVNL